MSKLRKQLHRLEEIFDDAKTRIKERLNLFDTVIIYPYRGFGNQKHAYLRGRILEREARIHEGNISGGGLWHNIKKLADRYASDEIQGVQIEGRFLNQVVQTTTNAEGYFHLEFNYSQDQEPRNDWYPVQMRITDMPYNLEYEEKASAEILVCTQQNSLGIISDVDDTIIQSHATNPLKKLKTMLKHNAKTRTPFEGVSDLYRLLVQDYKNPLFFVSGSSFNLYDLLVDFCRHHNIPKAPFLLRDLGLDQNQWFKKDTIIYKLKHIEKILRIYPDMKFILIGDSGQKDPEVYFEVCEKYPGRILAIYIRQVESDQRKMELEVLREKMDTELLLMKNSHEAIVHARKREWIS